MNMLYTQAAAGFREPSFVSPSFVPAPAEELAPAYPTFDRLPPFQAVPPLPSTSSLPVESLTPSDYAWSQLISPPADLLSELFPEPVQSAVTPVRVSTRRARGGHNQPAATGYAAMMVRSFQNPARMEVLLTRAPLQRDNFRSKPRRPSCGNTIVVGKSIRKTSLPCINITSPTNTSPKR
jgi:hypothetical protein